MIVYVDFDGTLAYFDTWKGQNYAGHPCQDMVNKIKDHLKNGDEVWIYTARVNPVEKYAPYDHKVIVNVIQEWCLKHIGRKLPVTGIKGPAEVFYDDRAIRIVRNTGLTMGEFLDTMLTQLMEENVTKEEALNKLRKTIKQIEEIEV